MLWGRYEKERDKLDLYNNPNFDPETGIADRDVLLENVQKMLAAMEGESHTLIKAKVITYILDHTAIEINPLDWFGINYCGWITKKESDRQPNGKKMHRPVWHLLMKWRTELPYTEAFKKASENIVATGAGSFYPDYDHSVPDWDSVIGLGFRGILERAKKYHHEKSESGTITPDEELYYNTVEMCYEALLRFMDRLIAQAKKHEKDDAKMPIMIECLETLRKGKAETLYQYLMMTYLYHLVQENLDSVQVRTLGNLDVDGYPFYKRDVEAGRLTHENAEELFQYFFESYANQGHMYGQPLYFGGFDKNGESLINELSFIMLDAYEKCWNVSPKLIIKVMPNTPDAFLKRALRMMRAGCNSIVFINEELGCKISRKLGRTEEETARLVGTGCNNFAARGCETTPEHMYVNLAKAIELAFFDGFDPGTGADIGTRTGDVSAFKTFEDFKNAYLAQAKCLINKAFIISDFFDEHLLDLNPAPIYSGTMPDSVRNGKDAYFNGVKYNNTVMFLSCHANVFDSLMMVKKYVYDRKEVSIETLRDALSANWEGYEALRETLWNDPEKYGNNIDSVDSLAISVTEPLTSMVLNRKNKRGGRFLVNGESITRAHDFGAKCGATPDGRYRGDVLSKNMSAGMGQDRNGITAHILSATKLDTKQFPYGCPFDYLLHPSAVKGEDGLDAMLGLLRTFMKRGGYGYQGSVQDAKTLRDAQAHPEKYPNLQVRISGWSWFFTQMEKKFQDEFIKRAEDLSA